MIYFGHEYAFGAGILGDCMSLFYTALPAEASGQKGFPIKAALTHQRQVGAGCLLGPQPVQLAKVLFFPHESLLSSLSLIFSLIHERFLSSLRKNVNIINNKTFSKIVVYLTVQWEPKSKDVRDEMHSAPPSRSFSRYFLWVHTLMENKPREVLGIIVMCSCKKGQREEKLQSGESETDLKQIPVGQVQFHCWTISQARLQGILAGKCFILRTNSNVMGTSNEVR